MWFAAHRLFKKNNPQVCLRILTRTLLDNFMYSTEWYAHFLSVRAFNHANPNPLGHCIRILTHIYSTFIETAPEVLINTSDPSPAQTLNVSQGGYWTGTQTHIYTHIHTQTLTLPICLLPLSPTLDACKRAVLWLNAHIRAKKRRKKARVAVTGYVHMLFFPGRCF